MRWKIIENEVFSGVLDVVKGGGSLCYPHLFKDGGIFCEWSGRDRPKSVGRHPRTCGVRIFYVWDAPRSDP